jgi:hypothetical protein
MIERFEERTYNEPGVRESNHIRNGKMQLELECRGNDVKSLIEFKRIVGKIFPEDFTTSIMSGHSIKAYVAAWKEGMWKTSDTPFNIPIHKV